MSSVNRERERKRLALHVTGSQLKERSQRLTLSIAGHEFDVRRFDGLGRLAELNLLEEQGPNVVAESVGAQRALERVSGLDTGRQSVVDRLVELSQHAVGQALRNLVLLYFKRRKTRQQVENDALKTAWNRRLTWMRSSRTS